MPNLAIYFRSESILKMTKMATSVTMGSNVNNEILPVKIRTIINCQRFHMQEWWLRKHICPVLILLENPVINK